MVIGFFLLGAIVGSFTGVVVERLYTGHSWQTGRSRCDSCGRTLSFFDLIPIVSWLLAKGRCRSCGSRIPITLLLIEAVLGTLFALFFVELGLSWSLVVMLFFVSVLAVVVLYDLRHMIVPPAASTLLVLIGALFLYVQVSDLSRIGEALLVAGAIGLGFFLLYLLSKGRAMGLGDTPVAFALSLVTYPYAFAGLLLSFWIGAVIGIVLLVLRRRGSTMGTEVPFVPFLACGFLLSFFLQWNPFSLPLL